ncbi:MAG: hypothetical protein WAU01_14615 [Saprospiraceae bacterium]
MKAFTTKIKTGGVITVRDGEGKYLYQLWDYKNLYGEVANIEIFIYQNKPNKVSENVLNAIKKAFNENGSVTYNCGNGNQTFYFDECE